MRAIHAEGVAYLPARDAPKLVAPLNLVLRIGHGNPTVERFVEFAVKMAK
jgi:hypothetical protein